MFIHCLALFLLMYSPASNASQLPTAFNGMVSKIDSSSRFEVGARTANWKTGVTRIYELGENGKKVDAPAAQVVHFGSYLHVEGKFEKTGSFLATAIQFLEPDNQELGKIRGIGLIEEAPQLHSSPSGITGTLWVDGYPLHIGPETKLLSADGKPFPAEHIVVNTWAAYDAVREPDGSIKTSSIRFDPNTVSPAEVRFREKSDPTITPPDYDNGKPGKIKFHYHWSPSLPWSLKILPDRATQEYVAKIGDSLIPEYQKNLPPNDPAKINFRFYVVESPSAWKEIVEQKQILDGVVATADGTVIVPDNVLAVLDNEAQLAALLSNSIAIAVEKQAYIHRTQTNVQNAFAWAGDLSGWYGIPINVGNGFEADRLGVQIIELTSRIGLRYMLDQGYDIREAAFAWNAGTNPQRSGYIPSGFSRSIIADLYFDDSSVDYSKLKTNRAAYQQMLAHLQLSAPKLRVPKNVPENAAVRSIGNSAH